MKTRFLAFILLLPTLAYSQATTAYHRLNQVLARGNSGVYAQIVPYAKIAVTNTATGLAGAIYVDPGLTVPVPNSVVTADSNGNYGYYFALQVCMSESITYPGGGSLSYVNICANTSPGGTVTSFAAPSASWPTWLVPTVTTSTTTPSLAVAASSIPNSALANSSFTLGSTLINLGNSPSAVTGLTIDGVSPTTMGYVDPTSSIQTQLNGKAASNAGTTVNGVLCTLSSTCTVTAPAGSLAGGALGSVPYQSAPNTTTFITSPTTSGHTFVLAWQPSGSAIAPTAIDLVTYLNTYLTTPSAIGGTTPAAGSFSSVKDTGAAAATGHYGLQIDTSGNITNTGLSSTGIARTCNANGCYEIEPNGTVNEWGNTADLGGGTVLITFPFTFPHSCDSVTVSTVSSTDRITWLNYPSGSTPCSTTGFSVSSNGTASSASWRAIGY